MGEGRGIPGIAMPIWLHLTLTVLCSIVGFFGGAVLGVGATVLTVWALHARGVGEPTLTPGGVVLGVLFVPLCALLGVYGGAWAANRLPARCPRCRRRTCRGRPHHRYRVGDPITYDCTACGHVHETWLQAGGD